MDELIERIAATAGIDHAIARRAAGIMISFLSAEAPRAAADALLDDLPGSRALAAETGGGGGGLFGVFNDLTGAGLGMGEIRGVATALLDYARAKAGQAKVDAVVAGIPGLAGLI